MRSDRLLAMLLLLQTHGRLAAPEIARRLEVSSRTVRRDAEALSAAGVPVYAERGRHGGIALLEGYRTDVTGMTDDEVRALLAVADPGPDGSGGALVPAAASAVRKLLAAVPAARRDQLDRARQRLLVEPRGWRRGEDPTPALPALETALAADERVRLRYRSAGAQAASWRTVDPYGLVSKGGTWYLVAAHRGRPRLYRLARVLAVARTHTPARRPDERTLPQVWATLRDRLEDPAAEVVVRLRVDRAWRAAVERVAAAQLTGPVGESDDTDEPGAGTVVLDAPFRSLGAVRALLGFGAAVEVLAPAHARATMAAAAAEAAALYAHG